MKAFLKTFVNCGGIFEGKVGREISRQSYRAELLAYTAARKIKKSSC